MKPYDIDQVETDLRAAIDAGDQQRIETLGAEMDALEAASKATHQATLLAAALWYAERGIPVFALTPGRKIPLGSCLECKPDDPKAPRCPGPQVCGHDTCHGVLDATVDTIRITRWWAEGASRNIGLATGHRFDVVDIDGPLGQQSRTERWDDIFGQVDADSIAKVLTPRPGGMHIYVPVTGDGNSGAIVPGVDYRGIGGYVVAPPSIIVPNGKDHPGSYRFLGTPNLDAATLAQAG